MPKQNFRKTGWTLGAVGALVISVTAAWFGLDDDSSCALDALPVEAVEVVADIRAGGPFDYPDNDGVHFGNYEGLLPAENSDFYREYTVETPGLNHRGARRIVTGGGGNTNPEAWYYTSDHYESFCEIPDAE